MKRRFWRFPLWIGAASLAAACVLSPVEDLPSRRGGNDGGDVDGGNSGDGSGGSLTGSGDPNVDVPGAAGTAGAAAAGAAGAPVTR